MGGKKPKAEDRAVSHTLGSPWLVTPMAFWMTTFFLMPLLFVVFYSFGYQGVYDAAPQLENPNFDNYIKAFTDPVYQEAFWRTMVMVVGNTIGCLIIGFPLAYFIARKAGKRKGLLVLLVILPFWTSFLIRTYAWINILRDDGLLNRGLQSMGLTNAPVEILFTNKAVILGLVYGYLPLMILPLFVSLDKIDESLIEAARDLGAGKWATFRRVTLPLAFPGIVAGCLLVAIPTTGEFIVPSLLGGDKVVIWGWLIFKAFTTMRDWAFGSALSNVLILFMLGMIGLTWALSRLWQREA